MSTKTLTAAQKRAAVVQRKYEQPWTLAARTSPRLRARLDKEGKVTPHFTWAEMGCTDGTPVPKALRPNTIRLCWMLEQARHEMGGVRMTVNGPYRTPAKNKAVGGAKDSYHVKAAAADFFSTQVDQWVKTSAKLKTRGDVLRIFEKVFAHGGVGNETSGTLHVDARGFKARFVTWVRS